MTAKFRQDVKELSVSIKTNAPRIEQRMSLVTSQPALTSSRPALATSRPVIVSAAKYNSALEQLAKE